MFWPKHIKMVNLTTHELKLIAGKRGIRNYKNMSKERLLRTLDQSVILKIAKNLKIAKMQNLSQNKLEQIAKMRRIKN